MSAQADQIKQPADLTLDDRRQFLRLPLEERRRRLAEQADELAPHYQLAAETAERHDWQSGDIVE